jgi:DNA methylase
MRYCNGDDPLPFEAVRALCIEGKDAQFKVGNRANPKERGKGTKNLKTDLEEELAEKITIGEGERRMRLSTDRRRKAIAAFRGDKVHHLLHGRNRTNVWDYASVNSMAGNRRQDLELPPTVKRTALVANALQDVAKRGDLVLDIFLGSGTSLIAAERTGRHFRGLDIDPAYVDVAVERWQAMTGKQAVLAARVAA